MTKARVQKMGNFKRSNRAAINRRRRRTRKHLTEAQANELVPIQR